MNHDEAELPTNPILSYFIEHESESEESGLVIRYHDPDTMEPHSEVRFDNVAVLSSVLETCLYAMRVLYNVQEYGFEAARGIHGLVVAIEPPDLTDVDLTVEDILEAKPGPG